MLLLLLLGLLAPLQPAVALPSYCPVSAVPSSFPSLPASAAFTAAVDPLPLPCFTATDPALSLGWSSLASAGSFSYRLDVACAGGLPAVNGVVAAAHALPSSLPAVAGGAVQSPQLVLFMLAGDNSTYDIETALRVTALSCLVPAAVSSAPPSVCWPAPVVNAPQSTVDSYSAVANGSHYTQQRSCSAPAVLVGSPSSRCDIAYSSSISLYQQWTPAIGQCQQPQYADCLSSSASTPLGSLSCPSSGLVVSSGSCACPQGTVLLQSEPGGDLQSWLCRCSGGNAVGVGSGSVGISLTCCPSTLLQNCEYVASQPWDQGSGVSCAAAASTQQLQAVAGGGNCESDISSTLPLGLNAFLSSTASTSVDYLLDGWSVACSSDSITAANALFPTSAAASGPTSLSSNTITCAPLLLPPGGSGAVQSITARSPLSPSQSYMTMALSVWAYDATQPGINYGDTWLVGYGVSTSSEGTVSDSTVWPQLTLTGPWPYQAGAWVSSSGTPPSGLLVCATWPSGTGSFIPNSQMVWSDIVLTLEGNQDYSFAFFDGTSDENQTAVIAPRSSHSYQLGYDDLETGHVAAMPLVTASISPTTVQPAQTSAVCCSLPTPHHSLSASVSGSTTTGSSTQFNPSTVYTSAANQGTPSSVTVLTAPQVVLPNYGASSAPLALNLTTLTCSTLLPPGTAGSLLSLTAASLTYQGQTSGYIRMAVSVWGYDATLPSINYNEAYMVGYAATSARPGQSQDFDVLTESSQITLTGPWLFDDSPGVPAWNPSSDSPPSGLLVCVAWPPSLSGSQLDANADEYSNLVLAYTSVEMAFLFDVAAADTNETYTEVPQPGDYRYHAVPLSAGHKGSVPSAKMPFLYAELQLDNDAAAVLSSYTACSSGYVELGQPDLACSGAALTSTQLPASCSPAPALANSVTASSSLRCYQLPLYCPPLDPTVWTAQTGAVLPVGSITSMILYEGWQSSGGGLSVVMSCVESVASNGSTTANWSLNPIPYPVKMQCVRPSSQLTALQTITPSATQYSYNQTAVVSCVSPSLSANPFTVTCGYDNQPLFLFNSNALPCTPLTTTGCEVATATNTGTVTCPASYLPVLGGGVCSVGSSLSSSFPTSSGWTVTCSTGSAERSYAQCCPAVDFLGNCSVVSGSSCPQSSIFSSAQASICCQQNLASSIVAQSPAELLGSSLLCPPGQWPARSHTATHTQPAASSGVACLVRSLLLCCAAAA